MCLQIKLRKKNLAVFDLMIGEYDWMNLRAKTFSVNVFVVLRCWVPSQAIWFTNVVALLAKSII